MRRRNAQPTPVNPANTAPDALQEFGDETQGRRKQVRRRRAGLTAGFTALALAVGIPVGSAVRDAVDAGNLKAAQEAARHKTLQGEQDKYKGFSCDLGSIAVVANLGTETRLNLGVTVRGADNAAVRAVAFDPQTHQAKQEVHMIGGGGGGDQQHSVLASVPSDVYNENVVLYAFNSGGSSVRCVNGFELQTLNANGATTDPTTVNIGTYDSATHTSLYPEEWPLPQ